MIAKPALCAAVAVTSLVLPIQAANANRAAASVVRVCAKNLGTFATCWILQKGGEWVIDKGFSEAWTRLTSSSADGEKGATAAPKGATSPAGAPKPFDRPHETSARIETLDAERLKDLAKVTRSPPGWLSQPGTTGVVIYTPPDWQSRLSSPAARQQLDERVKSLVLRPSLAVPPAAAGSSGSSTPQPSSPAEAQRKSADVSTLLLSSMLHTKPCHQELESKLGLSVGAILLAAPAQRTGLWQRRQTEVLDVCAKRP